HCFGRTRFTIPPTARIRRIAATTSPHFGCTFLLRRAVEGARPSPGPPTLSERHIMSSRRLASAFARLCGLVLIPATAALTAAGPVRADDPGWPRQFDSPSGSFVIYQPQPEDLYGNTLEGRAAFSLKKSDDAIRTFGVLWYTEQVEIDRDSSTVVARNLDVTKVRLPGITSDEAARYESLVEEEAARWDLSGSLEELRAGLAAAEKERASVAGLDNEPPHILFSNQRAILVVY